MTGGLFTLVYNDWGVIFFESQLLRWHNSIEVVLLLLKFSFNDNISSFKWFDKLDIIKELILYW